MDPDRSACLSPNHHQAPLSPAPVEWRKLLPQLATYARRRCRSDPERAREIAQEAAARAWEAGLVAHDVEAAGYVLRGFVNGLAVNDRRRWRRTREIAVDDERMASFAGGVTPEEAFLEREQRELIFGRLRDGLREDAVGMRIVDLLEERIEDAAAQARALGLPIKAIRNGRKRVFRALRGMVRAESRGQKSLSE